MGVVRESEEGGVYGNLWVAGEVCSFSLRNEFLVRLDMKDKMSHKNFKGQLDRLSFPVIRKPL